MCSARHVPSPPQQTPPHLPPHFQGAVSEFNDSIVFQEKATEAKEGALSRRSIPDWPAAAQLLCRSDCVQHSRERNVQNEPQRNTFVSAIISKPRWTASQSFLPLLANSHLTREGPLRLGKSFVPDASQRLQC